MAWSAALVGLVACGEGTLSAGGAAGAGAGDKAGAQADARGSADARAGQTPSEDTDALRPPGPQAPPDASAAEDAAAPAPAPDARDWPDAPPGPVPPPDAAIDDAGEPADVGPPAPSFESLPWEDVGVGVGHKDTQEPAAQGVFIGYAGYQVTDDEARAWVTALYHAALIGEGVRHVYAVRGPMEVQYDSREIGNTALSRSFLPTLVDHEAPVLVAAHSSGTWVACEQFEQLFEGDRDPMGLARGRVVYFDLDGASGCLTDAMLDAFQGLYFVQAVKDGNASLNGAGMVSAAERLAGRSTLLSYDAADSGCRADARMCLHMTLINTQPHDPGGASRTADYSDFEGRPVHTWYLDASRGDRLP